MRIKMPAVRIAQGKLHIKVKKKIKVVNFLCKATRVTSHPYIAKDDEKNAILMYLNFLHFPPFSFFSLAVLNEEKNINKKS